MSTTQQPEMPPITYALLAIVSNLRNDLGQQVAVKWIGAYITETPEVPTYADSGAMDHFFNRGTFTDYVELMQPMKGRAALKSALFYLIS